MGCARTPRPPTARAFCRSGWPKAAAFGGTSHRIMCSGTTTSRSRPEECAMICAWSKTSSFLAGRPCGAINLRESAPLRAVQILAKVLRRDLLEEWAPMVLGRLVKKERVGHVALKGQQLSSPAQVHPSLTRWLPSDDAVCAKPRNRTGALEGTSTQNQRSAKRGLRRF